MLTTPDRNDARFLPSPSSDTAAIPAVAPVVARGFSRRLLLATTAGVILLAAVIWGIWTYLTIWQFEVSTNDAYVQADVVSIAPQVTGYISRVAVEDNQHVKAGQLLAMIDQGPYLAAVDQAKAGIASAQADIAAANAQLKQQSTAIDQARAAIGVDQATEVYAQQNNVRFGTLAKQGFGTLQDAQRARSQTESAQASVARDKAELDNAQQQVAVLRAQLQKSQANLLLNTAQLKAAELNLNYTTITSPVDGVVGDRTLRLGEYVQAGTQLMAIVPLQDAYIVANFEETQLTNIRTGQLVEVVADAFPDVIVHGVVNSIAPASGQEFALLPPDNATGNFTKIVQRVPVKITLDPKNSLRGLLSPGMSVTPTITIVPTSTRTLEVGQ